MNVERAVLATRRLRLEPLAESHAAALWTAVESSRAELRPWLFWAIDASADSTRAFARSSEQAWVAGTDWVFALVHRGEPVGTIGLHGFDGVGLSAELGYWLRSADAGRGLMTEAGQRVVSFGFDRLALHRIWLRAAPHNVRSVRVARKLGFRVEGRLREAGRGEHGWHDEWVFGLLAADREESRQRGEDVDG